MRIRHVPIFAGLVWSAVVLPSLAGAEDAVSSRLPAGVPPVLGMWAWSEPEFAPQGYRAFLDLAAEHAAYNLITTTLRIPKKELTDDDVHAQ
ncbi:MAG: hypothetical protein GYA33_06955, partial [Thermogutta sp.]|nr:hypothetical protein [Thermogutta sp.]